MATLDREQKYLELKKNLAWTCCSDLLDPPLQVVEPLRFLNSDTDEMRKQKRLEHKRKSEERDQEKKERETELVSAMDKVIDRVKQALSEYKKNGVNYNAISEAYRQFKLYCDVCKNQNANNTILDPKTGDIICTGKDGEGCGQVIQDHSINMGAEKRNFEGEENKDNFGPQANELMSDAWNMSTDMSTFNYNGKEDARFKRLSMTAQNVEMNLSNIGSDEHRTREGYKNKQKKEAFYLMKNLADNLHLHNLVVSRAEEEFSYYRDMREAIQQYKAVVCACILIAYEELSLHSNVDIKAKIFSGPRLSSDSTTNSNSNAAVIPQPDKNDPAEYCLSDIPIAKWNIHEVKEWLLAVSQGKYDSYVQSIITHIQNILQVSTNTSTKTTTTTTTTTASSSSSSYSTALTADNTKLPKYGAVLGAQRSKYENVPSFLGTTTIAGRNKKLMQETTHATINNTMSSSLHTNDGMSTPHTTAGKLLVALKLSSIKHIQSILVSSDTITTNVQKHDTSTPMEIKKLRIQQDEYFNDAIRRRSRYEIKRKEAYDNLSKQTQRLTQETSSYKNKYDFNHLSMMKSNHHYIEDLPSARSNISESMSIKSEFDASGNGGGEINLNELFGGQVEVQITTKPPEDITKAPTTTTSTSKQKAKIDSKLSAPLIKEEKVSTKRKFQFTIEGSSSTNVTAGNTEDNSNKKPTLTPATGHAIIRTPGSSSSNRPPGPPSSNNNTNHNNSMAEINRSSSTTLFSPVSSNTTQNSIESKGISPINNTSTVPMSTTVPISNTSSQQPVEKKPKGKKKFVIA